MTFNYRYEKLPSDFLEHQEILEVPLTQENAQSPSATQSTPLLLSHHAQIQKNQSQQQRFMLKFNISRIRFRHVMRKLINCEGKFTS